MHVKSGRQPPDVSCIGLLAPRLHGLAIGPPGIATTQYPIGEPMNDLTPPAAIRGEEHWTDKDGKVKLFLFEKCSVDPKTAAGRILFVHGSSMAAQPTFDLQVAGRPDSSVMDWFARRGFDCWCVDME